MFSRIFFCLLFCGLLHKLFCFYTFYILRFFAIFSVTNRLADFLYSFGNFVQNVFAALFQYLFAFSFCQTMILRIFSLKLFANFVQKLFFRFFLLIVQKLFFTQIVYGFFLKGLFTFFNCIIENDL